MFNCWAASCTVIDIMLTLNNINIATTVAAWAATSRAAALEWLGDSEVFRERDSARDDHNDSGGLQQNLAFIREVEGLSRERTSGPPTVPTVHPRDPAYIAPLG